MDSVKFRRNYVLYVENGDGDSSQTQLTNFASAASGGAVNITASSTQKITLPTTIEFDIVRNNTSSTNVCQIRIYNLAEKTRNNIRFNRFNGGVYRNIMLQIGYGNNMSTVFAGNYNEAWSFREGVNFITQIEAYDGGYALLTGNVDLTFPAGTPYQVIIKTIMEGLPNVTIGGIGTFPGVLKRPNTYQGSASSILFELTNGGFFIDHEKAYALANSDYLPRPTIATINASTGLLGTPLLEQNLAHFDMLLEPALAVGDLVNIESTTTNIFTGFYKTCTVKHKGTISAVISGTATTTAEFTYIKNPVPAMMFGIK